MTYRPAREKGGFVNVWCKGDRGAYTMARNEFDSLHEAWRLAVAGTGPRLYEGLDLYGDPIVLDLLEIRAIGEASPAGLAAYDTEEDERRAYHRTHGED